MKQEPQRLFYSKVLLFGEYSLMYGSKALSIPFQKFNGRFIKTPVHQLTESEEKSKYYLNEFAKYLKSISADSGKDFTIDLDLFNKDIAAGMIFQSNIPLGYGLGSSGALVAAVFDEYGNKQIHKEDIAQLLALKEFLGRMESCFHGKSSGLDPLICYLNKPLLIEGKDNISIAEIPDWHHEKPGAVFLIDSGSPGETQPLVDLFVKRCMDDEYLETIKTNYIPLVNSCVEAYNENDAGLLVEKLKSLSAFQLEYFIDMIPGAMQTAWKRGIESGNYSLKLCGSGGGGMMLGFTPDFDIAKKELIDQKITLIHRL